MCMANLECHRSIDHRGRRRGGGGQQRFQISTCLLEREGGQVIKARGKAERAKRESGQGLLRS